MTPRIAPLSDDAAPADSLPVLERTGRALGLVPNLHRALAHSPAALKAYDATVMALAAGALAPSHRERIAVATAARNGCGYCASAHTLLGRGAGLSADELTANLSGESLDARGQALLSFAGRLLETSGAVQDAEVAAVRAAGFSDAELVETVAHVALNVFTNTFNVLARTPIDFPEVELPTR